MSVIKAGTTLTTAYTVEADTTGALEFKTGTSATLAMSISASGVVTFPATTGFDIASANITNLTSGTTSATVLRSASGTITNLLATTLTISGVGVFPAGTVSAPAITTSGDTNTGIFFPAADTIAFAEGGVESMRIDSSGNLGIGTASPAYRLDVQNPAATTWLRIGNAAINSGAAIIFNGASTQKNWVIASQYNVNGGLEFTQTTAGGGSVIGSTPAMTLDASGRLGIGTTSPARRLEVKDSATDFIAAAFTNTNSTGSAATSSAVRIGVTNSVREVFTEIKTLEEGNDNNETSMVFSTTTGGAALTERARITSAGNVGIGTTNPIYRLSVESSGQPMFSINSTNADGGYLGIFGSGLAIGYIGSAKALVTSSSLTDLAIRSENNLIFSVNTFTERARITSGGKFCIGTTTPVGTLTVDSASTINTGASDTYAITCGNDVLDAVALGSDSSFSYIQSFASKPLILNSVGNEVRVSGTTDNGAFNLQVNGTGVWGAGAYVNGSDERLKDDIQSLDSGLDIVKAMRPVTFKYKPEHSKDQSVQPGFIAQELQQAMAGKPYLDGVVQAGPEYLNVAYQNIIPILVKAIQELSAKVAALESK